jgi:hypothetical protein
MYEQVQPDEAARALAEVGRRRDQVADLSAIPWWFHWTVILLTIAFALALDSQRPVLIGIGVTVFVIGVLLALAQVLGRSMVSAPLRRDLLGPRAALAIIVFVGLILAVNLPTAFILRAAGVPYPATIGALAGAVVIFIGGPRLSRHLRRLTRTGSAL